MLHTALLHTHSMLRWILLLLLFANIGLAIKGLATKAAWVPLNKKLSAALLGTTHLQILIGLLLYVGVSPMMGAIFSDFGAAMKTPALRFWAVEHIFSMILAGVAIHVGHVMAKRAEEDGAKFKRALIGFTLGLLLIFAAIPWPFRDAIARPLLPF